MFSAGGGGGVADMMVANSFDMWQKDAFFTAAEEVQESADLYVPVLISLVLYCIFGAVRFICGAFM